MNFQVPAAKPFRVPKMNTGAGSGVVGSVGAPGDATPQQKMLAVADQLGIEGMEVMQATSRTLWDTLPLDGRLVFDFFRQCNTRPWPLTNLTQNKLEVGEAFICEWMSLTVGDLVAAAPPVNAFYRITGGLTSFPDTSYFWSDLSLTVANDLVMKPTSLIPMFPDVSKDANYVEQSPFSFFTLLGIPSMQEFFAQWRIQENAVVADTYVTLTLSGTGIIYRAPSAL